MRPKALGLSLLLLIAAVICFAIALLIVTGVVRSDTGLAWAFGGLLSFAASFLPLP